MRAPRICVFAAFLVALSACSTADESHSQRSGAVRHRPWTLRGALKQAELDKHDIYSRYVAIHLAAQRGEAEKNRVLRSLTRMSEFEFRPRPEVNLFSFTTGALAIHESLQLEQMFREVLEWPDDEFRRFRSRRLGQDEKLADIGDNGPASKAILLNPRYVAADAKGNLFVVDYDNSRVRKIDHKGTITTVYDFDRETSSQLGDLSVDGAGQVWYADVRNNRILQVKQNGDVKEILRQGRTSFASALRDFPITVDGQGNLFFLKRIKDKDSICRIRSDGTFSVVSTVAQPKSNVAPQLPIEYGNPLDIYHPSVIVHDKKGNIYFAEAGSRCVKRLGPKGNVTIVAGRPEPAIDSIYTEHAPLDAAGGDGGPATEARLWRPAGLAIDGEGSLYISDALDCCIRKVDGGGRIHTVAGSAVRGYSGDGGLATKARLYHPRGLAIDQTGNLYIADEGNLRIRKVDKRGRISTIAGAYDFSKERSLRRSARDFRRRGSDEPAEDDDGPLRGPKVRSHPFEKMLAGRRPIVSQLADIVPHDFYYIRFRSFDHLLKTGAYAERVGTHLRSQVLSQAFSSDRREFVLRQLCLSPEHWSESSLEQHLQEVVVTGSDLYWELGSDVSVLFRWKDREQGSRTLAKVQEQLLEQFPKAVRRHEPYRGATIDHVATPDRRVNFYAAELGQDVSVRSNSPAALRRLIDTWRTSTAENKNALSLSHSLDFLYVRTLMPKDADEEDGMVFLSDAFIRRQVGPTLRIKQRRRLLCYNSMRTVQHAALMHRTQTGSGAVDIEALVGSGCLSQSAASINLKCPDEGKHALSSDGVGVTCSVHGSVEWMHPCHDVPLTTTTPEERSQYREFVRRYSRFWEEYFDPIGMRVKLTEKAYRLETVILPLIQNSVYDGLSAILSDNTSHLSTLRLPDRTVLGVAARLDKRRLFTFAMTGELRPELNRVLTQAEMAALIDVEFAKQLKELDLGGTWRHKFGLGDFLTKGLGDEIGVYVCDSRPNFNFNMARFMGDALADDEAGPAAIASFIVSSLSAPVYVAVPVKDKQLVDDFLRRIHPWLGRLAQKDSNGFIPLRYQYSRSKIDGCDVRSFAIHISGFGVRGYALRLGDNLIIASQRELVSELIAAHKQGEWSRQPIDRSATGHLQAWVRPQNWKQSAASYDFEWAATNQESCIKNLASLTNVARAGFSRSEDDILAKAALRDGRHYSCPSSGKYVFDLNKGDVDVHCTLHGSVMDSRQPPKPPEATKTIELLKEMRTISATVKMTPEGLRAILNIQRDAHDH